MAVWYTWLAYLCWSGFGFCTVVQIWVWVRYPLRGIRENPEPQAVGTEATLPPVTVIVCARNERNNLQRHLVDLLEQEYPGEWTILVVDDDSSDGSGQLLAEWRGKYPHLQVLSNGPKQYAGKKAALSAGIQAAATEWLAVTDADCKPAGPHWLSTMMRRAIADHRCEMVLGYAPLTGEKGWLSRLAEFETIYTAMQYLSLAMSGQPFMGVGRNMVWKKPLFQRSDGFEAHRHIPSGDDDLFVNAVALGHNTTVCLSEQTFVYSAAPVTWRDWLRQKSRHLGAGLYYRWWTRIQVGAVAFTYAGHYGFGLLLLALNALPGVVAGLWVLRLTVVWWTYKRWLAVFRAEYLLVWVPLLDGLLAFYFGAVAPFLLLFSAKKTDWKT